jgi:hypothetical protein
MAGGGGGGGGMRPGSRGDRAFLAVRAAMIRLWPITYLKWKEPRAISRSRQARMRSDRRLGLLRFPAAVGLMLLVWLVAHLDPEKSPPRLSVALLLAAIAGVLLANVVPGLYGYVAPRDPHQVVGDLPSSC